MAKCNFCEETIRPGKGTMYVKKDGKIMNFCSMKCQKNRIKLGRRAKDTKWTKKYIKGGES